MKHLILLALLIAACSPADTGTTIIPEEPMRIPEAGEVIICEEGKCSILQSCPTGYDEFGSQVGPACTRHYDKEDMAQWPTCSRSYSGCECTVVDRDTAGAPVAWETEVEALRCAPETYRSYMVHGGLSGVDEWGRGYTMIA